MDSFWNLARRLLDHRLRLARFVFASLLEAACAFASLGALVVIINQLFGEQQRTIQQIVRDMLGSERVQNFVGDLTGLADAIPADPFWGFVFVLAVILLFGVVGASMRVLGQSTAITVVLSTIMRIRKDAFHRLIHTPYELLLRQGSLDNLSRVVRDSDQIGKGFHTILGKTFRNVLLTGVYLLLALLINWQLTALFLVAVPIVAVLIRKFGKRIRRATRRKLSAYGTMLGATQEAMQALPVVKVFTAEGYERRRFNTINREVFAQEMRARLARAFSAPVIEFVAMVAVMAVALVAAWLVYRTQQVQAPELLNVLLMLAGAGVTARPLAKIANDLNEAAAAARRVEQVLQLPVEHNVRGEYKTRVRPDLPRHEESIVFENVSYTYPEGERPAIAGIDLRIAHGQTVAIVGPNGSGKSTLLSLLPRLTDPQQGHIYIDETDITHVSLRSLRRQIAVVTQQSFLFQDTVANNIAYGRRYASRGEIEAAAKAAYAHEFIEPLRDAYDTMLGEAGVGLSGGQRQRVCLARAILRDPAILILDEATSQVDAESEAKINAALREFRRDRTMLVIAHRLSTVIEADRIVVMDAGQVIDTGTHQQLLDRCDVYRMLARTQLAGAESGAPRGAVSATGVR